MCDAGSSANGPEANGAAKPFTPVGVALGVRPAVADVGVRPEPVLQEVVLHRDAGLRRVAVLLLLDLERVVV